MIPENQIGGFLGMTLIVVGFGFVVWVFNKVFVEQKEAKQ